MAKVAIASEGDWVSAHFGHCPEYTIFELEGNAVGQKVVVPNPGHQPGFLPQYLGRLGVTHVIAGGMGPRAQQLFLEQGIEPILGISGRVEEVIRAFAAGALRPGESTCHQPEGHDCGHHGGGARSTATRKGWRSAWGRVRVSGPDRRLYGNPRGNLSIRRPGRGGHR